MKAIERQIAEAISAGDALDIVYIELPAAVAQALLDVARTADYWSPDMEICMCHCDRCRERAKELQSALKKLKEVCPDE